MRGLVTFSDSEECPGCGCNAASLQAGPNEIVWCQRGHLWRLVDGVDGTFITDITDGPEER